MKWFGSRRKQQRSRSRGEYDDAPKWTLVNDFTIHEDRKLDSGRPFARNCVPKRLHLTLTRVSVINDLEWQAGSSREERQRPRGYKGATTIRFDATLEDRITVFTMDKGVIETFRELKGATIYPLPEGEIGGKRNATVVDGIYNATSELIPDKGFMEGEPGVLNYFEARETTESAPGEESALLLSLFIDEPAFEKLGNKLANSVGRAGSIRMSVLIELFEGEVDARLNDPVWGFGSEYGLLLRPDSIKYASARLNSISVVDQEQQLVAWDAKEEKEPSALETAVAGLATKLDRMTWLLAAITILLILLWLR